MTEDRPSVVFDSNVFFQAMISPGGPAGKLKQLVDRGELVLFVSDAVLDEARDVATRPFLKHKYGLTTPEIDAWLEHIPTAAVRVPTIEHVYDNPFDPDDSHYADLAVAARATRIITRDKDLLRLMEEARPEARDFMKRFPGLRIVDPSAFLSELRRAAEQTQPQERARRPGIGKEQAP